MALYAQHEIAQNSKKDKPQSSKVMFSRFILHLFHIYVLCFVMMQQIKGISFSIEAIIKKGQKVNVCCMKPFMAPINTIIQLSVKFGVSDCTGLK